MYLDGYHIHFVGIGGIGMSGIAELLLNQGYHVSGSDLAASDITRRLTKLGGRIYKGHSADQIKGANVLVMSSAVKEDNPEVAAAGNAAIPVIPRAEMLAELMRIKHSIAVAGAHGKTSTTSIVASILDAGGLDPTVVIGGKLNSINTNAVLGEGKFIVAEADESDGSFLKYAPAIAVVTNIDREHLDFYKDFAAIESAFLEFIDRIPFYGLAVLCLDNEPLQNLIPVIKKRYVTYGLSAQADYRAVNPVFEGLRSRFKLEFQGEKLGMIKLNLTGIHNVHNTLAAIAVGRELGISMTHIRRALNHHSGVQRRMQVKGEKAGITVVDDYGHHPTEIKATLDAVASCWPGRRRIVVFQPHRYSRTKALFDDFSRSFYQSDGLIMLPIYAASETPIDGIHSDLLCEAIRAHGHKNVVCVGGRDSAVARLEKICRAKDVVLTLGAGDVWKVGESFLEKIVS